MNEFYFFLFFLGGSKCLGGGGGGGLVLCVVMGVGYLLYILIRLDFCNLFFYIRGFFFILYVIFFSIGYSFSVRV